MGRKSPLFLEVAPEQISSLDSTSLVHLLKKLLMAEAFAHSIPLRNVSVPLQITVADGGEDARVEWGGGPGATDYLPARFCIFQSKASALSDAQVKHEVWEKGTGRGKGARAKPPVLNAAVSEVLKRRGAYVVFCRAPMVTPTIDARKAAIATAIREAGGTSGAAAAIEFYDGNKIAAWVNRHHNVAAWVHHVTHGLTLDGVQSMESWGQEPSFSVEWVPSDAARYAVSTGSGQGALGTPGGMVLSFKDAGKGVREHLAEPRRIVRIMGASGLGKSRSAYEIFRSCGDLADELGTNSVLFADCSLIGERIGSILLHLAEAGTAATIVVDECPERTHENLAKVVRRQNSKLRLVTIDFDARPFQNPDTMNIVVQKSPADLVEAIARNAAPDLRTGELDLIKRTADGFPEMAVLAARARAEGGNALLVLEDVIDRVLWGRATPDEVALRAIRAASLFSVLGCTEQVADDLRFIAERVARMPVDEVYAALKRFEKRGIVLFRGRYAAVQPLPLAVHLAARQLAEMLPETVEAIAADAPSDLVQEFFKRLQNLDFSPEAKRFAERQLAQGGALSTLDALSSDRSARLFGSLVHVTPDWAMTAMDRALGGLADPELKRMGPGRRYLVWALEKLAFRLETFDPAARLLLRLAVAETDRGVGNNATGVFKHLFNLYLSGTQAPPDQRLAVLDFGLASKDGRAVAICLDAAAEMLKPSHFSRSGGIEQLGSRPPLEDWQPGTYQEIFDFHRAGLSRLQSFALDDSALGETARKHVASAIDGLICPALFEDVKQVVQAVSARFGPWHDAVQTIGAWLHFDRAKAELLFRGKVREFYDSLLPTEEVEKVLFYSRFSSTGLYNPDLVFNRDDPAQHDFRYADRALTAAVDDLLARPGGSARLLPRIVTGHLRNASALGQRLAQESAVPTRDFAEAVRMAEASGESPNLLFFCGYLRGLRSRDDLLARSCLVVALQSAPLPRHLVALLDSVELTPEDLVKVADALRSGTVSPEQCRSLSHGQSLDHLAPDVLRPMIAALVESGANGIWSAFDIVHMYRYQARPMERATARIVLELVSSPSLASSKPTSAQDSHALGELIEVIVSAGLWTEADARVAVERLFEVIGREDSGFYSYVGTSISGALATLTAAWPQVALDEVARRLEDKGDRALSRLASLMDFASWKKAGNFLTHLEPDRLFSWIQVSPAARGAFVATFLPLFANDQDAPDGRSRGAAACEWHPLVVRLADEFGSEQEVLDAIRRRLRPGVTVGPRAPYQQVYLAPLKVWFNHRRPEVRSWAREVHQLCEREIERLRKIDQEHDLGVW